jgi:mannosyltransferase
VTEGIAAGSTVHAEAARSTVAWRLAPPAVAVASLALGFAGLGRRSLSTDEAGAFVQADGSFSTVLGRILHENPGHAGSTFALELAGDFGRGETAVRAPSAIAVAVAAGLLVVLATMVLGRVGGVVAGLAFAANAAVIEASREARPYALGLAGIVLATLLFSWALERGGGARWIAYGAVAALLPLTHPLAASVLVAQGAALVTLRHDQRLRRAGAVLLAASAAAALLLVWMARDRHGTPDAAGIVDLERLARACPHAAGWSPVLLAAAVAGLVALFTRSRSSTGLWRGVLVAGLIAAPLLVTLAAAPVLPVFSGALVLAAPGLALAAGAAATYFEGDRRLVWGGMALLLVSSLAAAGIRVTRPAEEDWRALAAAVQRVQGERETVVVVPERARAALAYYAPDVRPIRFARGEGAWVAVAADTPGAAIAAARPFVRTPRYALLRQFRYGDGLRLQHWIRP